ncbi:AraC family transcriptional regulator [Bradyrhizobium iriomotense]|uniref:AraC family transcriptional regulator n=1 Tax=Bradyrhizobium iriomotense TaxID=441950 RepID=A0ABQ6AXB4_9BRAD|nr:AraC family transcriptional regulator [Bradyrhizobium iriomotense]GLR84533.1 AraC family transcriptional regulator [Bradyrhizobium iriomotense]
MQDTEPFRRAHISTRDFPEAKRLQMWREAYGRGIANVDIEPIGDQPFHADVTFNLLPNVSIAAGSRSPAHYRVSKELATRGKDLVAISMLRSGRASATQFGKELISGVGSASVIAPLDPSTSTMLTEGSFITLLFSLPAIARLAPHFSRAFGRPIPNNNEALRLLTRYVDILGDLDSSSDPAVARSASAHLIDLAALALGANGDYAELARQRGGTAARLTAIKSDILAALGDSELSTEAIAARHGISPRYVRKLFEQDGSSFSAFVLTERLAKAQRMLVDRRYRHLNIAQIAHESGFGDVSYFNRVFRRQFGSRPSDLREAAKCVWREQRG